MTLFECFDFANLENIAGSLAVKPDKVIFLGKRPEMATAMERYRLVLEGRKMETRVEPYFVESENLHDMVEELAQLIRRERECIIDLNGGEESILIAIGAALGTLTPEEQRRITVRNTDLREQQVDLTVWELIRLHGGIIYPRQEQPDVRYGPRDLEPLWNVLRQDYKAWNKAMGKLIEFESKTTEKLHVVLSRRALAEEIADYEGKESEVEALLEALDHSGAIRNRSDFRNIRYEYANPLLAFCMDKVGNSLEVKTLLEARAMREGGIPYFQDCQMSVNIDWDGDGVGSTPGNPETKNEIDVILIHGMTPVFISCKNGAIGDDELYKLNTVASRFGGKYARKMLIATNLERKSEDSNLAFVQRAKDMHITLVEDAAKLTAEGWVEALKNAAEGIY